LSASSDGSLAHLPDLGVIAAHLGGGAALSLLISFLLARRWRPLSSGREQMPFDRRLLSRLRARRKPGLNALARLLALFGSPPLIVCLALAGAAAGVFFRHIRGAAWALPLAVAGAGLLIQGAKVAFRRPRPALSRPLLPEHGYSFPSGHSLIAVVVYGLLGFFTLHFYDLDAWALVVGLVTLGLIFLIGLSRVYVGVHYPSDVLAGWASGLPWLIACIWLHEALARHWHQAAEPVLHLRLVFALP
jgi:undecaprenyl-diphosphatase